MSLKIVVYKNNETIKKVNVSVDLDDFVEYRKLLNTSQKDINEYLTSLIGQDIADDSKTLEESSDSEEDMDGNDTSDNTHGNNTKKVKLM